MPEGINELLSLPGLEGQNPREKKNSLRLDQLSANCGRETEKPAKVSAILGGFGDTNWSVGLPSLRGQNSREKGSVKK